MAVGDGFEGGFEVGVGFICLTRKVYTAAPGLSF